MTKNTTIVLFYTVIAIFCGILIAVFIYWGRLREEKTVQDHSVRKAERIEEMRQQQRDQFKNYGLRDSFTVIDQHGKELDLKDGLSGKVVVLAQFYAACPHCDAVNMGLLREVLDKYGEHNDLQIIAVNVNEQAKGTEKLLSYWQHEKKGNNSPQWIFATTKEGEINAFNEWAVKNLAFARFEKNRGVDAEIEPVKHDMGVVVIKRDGVMFAKEDYYSALSVSARENEDEAQNKAFAEDVKNQLMEAVKVALEN